MRGSAPAALSSVVSPRGGVRSVCWRRPSACVGANVGQVEQEGANQRCVQQKLRTEQRLRGTEAVHGQRVLTAHGIPGMRSSSSERTSAAPTSPTGLHLKSVAVYRAMNALSRRIGTAMGMPRAVSTRAVA